MSEKRDLKILSKEEKKIIDLWKDIIKYIKRDLAYVWTPEVRMDFLKIKKETKKVEYILKKLHSYHKENYGIYSREISDIKAFTDHLNKLSANPAWIKLIKMDLEKVISDIEISVVEEKIETLFQQLTHMLSYDYRSPYSWSYVLRSEFMYLCGYPKDRFFDNLLECIEKLSQELVKFISEYRSNPLLNKTEKAKEVYIGYANQYKDLVYLKPMFEKVKILTESITKLSADPIAHRNEIINYWNELSIIQKGTINKISKNSAELIEKFIKGFLFNKVTTIQDGLIYHRVSYSTTYWSERWKDSIQMPEHYAKSIINIVDSGINPTNSDKEFNCCSKLPAVFFLPDFSPGGELVVIALSCKDYPAFRANLSERGILSKETMIYTTKPLKLKRFGLIFTLDFKRLRGCSDGIESLIKVIGHLPDITPSGKELKIIVPEKIIPPRNKIPVRDLEKEWIHSDKYIEWDRMHQTYEESWDKAWKPSEYINYFFNRFNEEEALKIINRKPSSREDAEPLL